MYFNTLFGFLIVFVTVNLTNGLRYKKFFRKDYKYLEASESFYKIHTLHRTWPDAKRMCALEGASLFYAENDNEANAVLSFWNDTQPFWGVYVGISALIVKGVFVTIDGIPVSDVYNNWLPGAPNDTGGVEDCVIMARSGTFNDYSCGHKFPFICKKSLISLEWNQPCKMANLDYVLNESLGSCYKFHTKPMNWTEAYAVCSAEQSYLAVLNSQDEADYLVQVTANAPNKRVRGNFTGGAVLLGFHNKNNEGWETVTGTALDDSGYVNWCNTQPEEDRERCGSMFYNGHLNDIACDQKSFFVCEHEVDTLATSLDVRFGVDDNFLSDLEKF